VTPHEHRLLPSLGMASLVLGHVGLLLFFLPVLGGPISAFGVLCGVLGLLFVALKLPTSLRWSVAGLAVSCLALAVNLTLHRLPDVSLHDRRVPRPWQPVPDRPAVPPPASQAFEQ
jgi:hypothetical protein